MREIAYTVHTFKEGETYIAYVPELDLSSCGATNQEARKNIRDAVQGFLESSTNLGSLDGILEEAGYTRKGDSWEAPEFVALERETVSLR
jgi:predicted RNase H-like HicB family nuclease